MTIKQNVTVKKDSAMPLDSLTLSTVTYVGFPAVGSIKVFFYHPNTKNLHLLNCLFLDCVPGYEPIRG